MKKILLALFLLLIPVAAQAQQAKVVASCGTLPLSYPAGSTQYDTVDVNGNTCISGSISASTSGFAPANTGSPISVTTGGVTGTLPSGAVVAAFNIGATNTAYCKLGASSTTNDIAIQPNSWFAFTVGAATQMTCITSASTTTVNLIGGTGLPTGAGGGGGGGAGSNVTIVGPLGQALAAASVPIVLTAAQLTTLTPPSNTGYATSANQSTEITSLGTIATNSGTQATAANQTTGNTSTTAIAAVNGTTTDTPCTAPATATACTQDALLKALLNVGQYPSGATAITASATGTTTATTATLAGTSGKTTYICSYSIRANATAATTVQNTITGVITATMTHQMWVAPAASGIGVDEQVFNPCVPASGTNTGIAVVSGAPGSGGLVSATATGYQL
jgi:hypothetical protein